MNILLTSASRKIWLIKAFEAAIRRSGLRGHVLALDKDPLSASLYYSRYRYLWPYSPGEEQVESLKKLCIKEDVRLVIPTRDGELPMFAGCREDLAKEGIMVMVSPLKTVEICQDKYAFFHFCRERGFLVPETWLPEETPLTPLPWFIKPRRGSSSARAARADSQDQARGYLVWCQDHCIIQRALRGVEYTVDIFRDNLGKSCSVVRERIEVVNGESYKSRTVKDQGIVSIAEHLAGDLGGFGHLTVQCIRDADGRVYVIEVNPRIGGGAKLGFEAGLDTPGWLIRMARGEPLLLDGFSYKEQLIMLRFTDDLFIAGDQVLKESSINASRGL